MKKIKSISDRVLNMFLTDVGAGACVPSQGCCCGAGYYENCYGQCVRIIAPHTCYGSANPRCA